MTSPRGLHVGVVVAAAVAVVGLVSGVQGTGRETRANLAAPPRLTPPAVGARSYADERVASYGPNANLASEWWRLLGSSPDLFAPVIQTPADRAAALARRGERRAYDGAPPTIPHAIDQIGVPGCLACHDSGAIVAGAVAPRMSHPRHDSCVQCHVVMHDPRPGVTTPATPETSFVGLAMPEGGPRAWAGAPPVIPHTTWMRERCDSCHGPRGLLGMRTPHPYRQSCTQCHAPAASFDQRAPAIIPAGAPR